MGVVRADTVCVPTPKAHSREARIGAEAAGVPLCEEVVCKEPTANQHEHMVLTHLHSTTVCYTPQYMCWSSTRPPLLSRSLRVVYSRANVACGEGVGLSQNSPVTSYLTSVPTMLQSQRLCV